MSTYMGLRATTLLGLSLLAAVGLACRGPRGDIEDLLGSRMLDGRQNLHVFVHRLHPDYTLGYGYVRFDATAQDVQDLCRALGITDDPDPSGMLRSPWKAERGADLPWWDATQETAQPACAIRFASGLVVLAKLQGSHAYMKLRIP